ACHFEAVARVNGITGLAALARKMAPPYMPPCAPNLTARERRPMTSQNFLAGGGEMGALTRALDWSKTPLGPPDSWQQSLRSAVSILLPSRAQIVLFWGPDLITLYNDAYRPVFGTKHPAALGSPVREAWSAIWGTGGRLQGLFASVL